MSQQDIDELVESLTRDRDELRLQFHLFKSEVRDEWAEIEKKWASFHRQASVTSAAAGEAAGEIGAAVRLLGEETRAGYRKIRGSLKAP